jgi:hypothetical protein
MALKSRAAASARMASEHSPLLLMGPPLTQKKLRFSRKLALLSAAIIICLVAVGTILHYKSQQIRRRHIVDCHAAPAISEDRRENKNKLVWMNYNAEWLFLFGGSGGIKCPSESCPWQVSSS